MDHTLLSIYECYSFPYAASTLRISSQAHTFCIVSRPRHGASCRTHRSCRPRVRARAVYLLRQWVTAVTFALVELTCGVRAPLVLLGRPTTGRSKLVVWPSSKLVCAGLGRWSSPPKGCPFYVSFCSRSTDSTLYFTLILQREVSSGGPALTERKAFVDPLDDGRPRSATAAAQTAPGTAARAATAVAQRDRTLPLYRARVPCAGRRG